MGYGHDKKGAIVGAAKNDGKVHVTHETRQRRQDRDLHPRRRRGRRPRRRDDLAGGAAATAPSIPHLCYSPKPGYRPDGNCRVCMVEVEGERVLAASCIRTPTPGMKVKTQTDRAKTARRMVVELLLTDQPPQGRGARSGIGILADRRPAEHRRRAGLRAARTPAPDRSHPAMAVNLDACIQCNLCVRACREVQVNDVIGMAGRGHGEKIVFDFDDPMGASTCVACGECVQACPTGALMPATLVDEANVRTAISGPRGQQRVPLLRRRLPAHLPHQGRQAALRQRPQRPGEREPALRQGPLRLRLCEPSASADAAAGAQGRRRQGRRRSGRSVQSVDAFPHRRPGRRRSTAPPRAW